jgi:plastocyanin/uncharacterized membrane protein
MAQPQLQIGRTILAVAAMAVVCAVWILSSPSLFAGPLPPTPQGPQSSQANGGAQHVVIIKQMHFDPPQMTVKAGDTVEWKNQDIFSHTATADNGSFDSGLIAPGASWKTTVQGDGPIAYHCGPHPNMKASLTVQAGAQGNAQAGGNESAATLKWSPPMSPEQFHPILVNFTAALFPLAFLSDILGRIFRRQSLHNAAWWMVLYAAAITPFTVAAGWWWKSNVGSALPPNLITVHQWLGTLAAVLFIVLAVWRWSIHKRGIPPSLAYLACALIAVLALVYQGSLGGKMLFGR